MDIVTSNLPALVAVSPLIDAAQAKSDRQTCLDQLCNLARLPTVLACFVKCQNRLLARHAVHVQLRWQDLSIQNRGFSCLKHIESTEICTGKSSSHMLALLCLLQAMLCGICIYSYIYNIYIYISWIQKLMAIGSLGVYVYDYA